jgi:hypothetical protein
VVVNGHRELHFLDHDDFLALAGGAITLFLFVEELAVVLNTADGRDGGGRNFHEVEAALASDLEGLKGRKDAELLAFFVDYADFARANAIVDADELFSGTLIDGFLSWPLIGAAAT